MRSSGSVHSVLEFQNVAGEIHRFSYQNELFPNDFLMPYSLSTFVHNDFRRTFWKNVKIKNGVYKSFLASLIFRWENQFPEDVWPQNLTIDP